MAPEKRIIVNTLVQYAKAVITTAVSLYAVRVVLEALTDSDYGLYQLIAGIVAMLGFITNSLIVTTQRYISLLYGRSDTGDVRRLFVSSMLLHFIIGTGLMLLLAAIEPWLMSDMLNIPPQRVNVAVRLYFITAFILFVTILSAPLKALFIARENITFISVVEVTDAMLKLLVAFLLLSLSGNRILIYVWAMAGIQILNFCVFYLYALCFYPECTLLFRRKDFSRNYMMQLLGFAGWTTYGMGAVTARAQGIAVVLNHFFGTAINAAYGIANQVYMGLTIVTTSIFNAMNPQIMKAEGEGNRQKVLNMAGRESKYSLSLMVIVAIPVIFEIDGILGLWLKEVPEHTALFCRFILISFLLDLLTLGFNTAVQAIGKLKAYTLIMYTPKLLTLPIAWVILETTGSVSCMMWAYMIIEFAMAMMRILYMHVLYDLNVPDYAKRVLLPALGLVATLLLVCEGCVQLSFSVRRILLTFLLSGLTGIGVLWCFTLSHNERNYIKGLIRNYRRK